MNIETQNRLSEVMDTFTFDPLTGWMNGNKGGYLVEAKIYDGPSDYGIKGGRISKLHIYTRPTGMDGGMHHFCNYDRGWDIPPKPEVHALYEAIVEAVAKAEVAPPAPPPPSPEQILLDGINDAMASLEGGYPEAREAEALGALYMAKEKYEKAKGVKS